MDALTWFEKLGEDLFLKSGEQDETIQPHKGDPFSKGKVNFGESSSTKRRADFIKGLFDVHQLTSLLTYATFDEEKNLFYNQDSVGFVLETETLVGANVDIQTQIQNFFNTSMPTESSLQVMLYADPMISDKTDFYLSFSFIK